MRLHLTLAALWITGCWVPPPPAVPDPRGLEGKRATVTTKDGAFEGHLRDARAGQQLVLVTRDGPRVFPWRSVLMLQLSPDLDPEIAGKVTSYADPAAGAAGRLSLQAWREGAPDARDVQITLTGDATTLVHERATATLAQPGGSAWEDYVGTRTTSLCEGPCAVTLRLLPDDKVYLDGRVLDLPPGQAAVHVDVRDRGPVALPVVALVLGALALPAGSGALAYGLRNDRDDVVKPAVGALVGGAALTTVGLVFLLTARPRAVRVSDAPLGVVRF